MRLWIHTTPTRNIKILIKLKWNELARVEHTGVVLLPLSHLVPLNLSTFSHCPPLDRIMWWISQPCDRPTTIRGPKRLITVPRSDGDKVSLLWRDGHLWSSSRVRGWLTPLAWPFGTVLCKVCRPFRMRADPVWFCRWVRYALCLPLTGRCSTGQVMNYGTYGDSPVHWNVGGSAAGGPGVLRQLPVKRYWTTPVSEQFMFSFML